MDFRSIEQKWQKQWEEKAVFEPKRKRGKKCFITVPYPYTSGPLHIGHARTYTLTDIWARYKRMQGFNTLFPMAFHISGTPILSVADRIMEGKGETIALYREYVSLYESSKKKVEKIVEGFQDPKKVAGYFSRVISRDFKSLGFSIDWSRSFTTGDPPYNKFIEWQFLTLKEKGLIKRGKHAVQFCPRDGNAVGEDDIKEGDILDTRIETFTLIKFPFKDGFLPAATLRPETIFGATNLWINPEKQYVKARVDGEVWYLSKEGLEKLEHQNHQIEKLESFEGRKLLNKKASSPVTKKGLPLLPASFVDPAVATGVVYSVPAHSPPDYVTLQDLNSSLKPLSVISLPGYGEFPAKDISEKMGIKNQKEKKKLNEATKKLYKEEFYKGVLKNSGKFSGISIKEGKESVKKWLKKEGKALDFFVSNTTSLVCRCGEEVVVKVLPDQWFIDYGNRKWKERARTCLQKMTILPERYRSSFASAIEWLHERACARKRGLGTKLPWDNKWVIESLSDSTIYPAFYLLAGTLKKNTIPPKSLTPAFFDFVFLGKGKVQEIEKTTRIKKSLLEKMRKDFVYWYPVDDRHTAVPHLTNHLTFYLFNHAILFPERFWPKMISLNELLIREGSKMSKSKGNVIPLADIGKNYSADLYRLFIASGAEMNTVIDWTEEGIEMVKKRLEGFIELAGKLQDRGEQKVIDQWLLSRFHTVLKDSEKDLNNFSFRRYIQRAFFDMMNDVSHYSRRGGERPGMVLKDWIKILSPVIPHVCEELWEQTGGKGFVSLENWPRAQEKLINPRLEKQEELVHQTLNDIKEILKIIKKTPKKIHIYSAPGWKYTVHRRVRGMAGKEFSIKELMKIPEIRKQGKQALHFAEKLRKDLGKLEFLLSEKEEWQAVSEAKEFFEKEFACDIQVIKALESTSLKAVKAEPGKPGIEVL